MPVIVGYKTASLSIEYQFNESTAIYTCIYVINSSETGIVLKYVS